jgi:hypothetical protein
MPSKSSSQHRLMAGCAHGWKPSGGVKCPPMDVAREFAKADKEGKKPGMRTHANNSRKQAET